MTWQADEQGTTTSEPVELYVFQSPTTTWRFTSYERDFTYGGNVYLAVPSARSNAIAGSTSDADDDLVVEIPATHALVQAYAAFIPPRELVATVLRYQTSSGIAIAIGGGYVTGLTFKGRMGSFRIPGASDLLVTPLPSVSASRLCAHLLYDARCTVARTSFQVVTTVATIATDRKSLTVASIGGKPDQWAQHGEVLHTGSTERRGVVSQVGTAIVLNYRLPSTTNVGDAVTIYAGCDHQVVTCFTKFLNVVNFGGMPLLPTKNVFYGLNATYKTGP